MVAGNCIVVGRRRPQCCRSSRQVASPATPLFSSYGNVTTPEQWPPPISHAVHVTIPQCVQWCRCASVGKQAATCVEVCVCVCVCERSMRIQRVGFEWPCPRITVRFRHVLPSATFNTKPTKNNNGRTTKEEGQKGGRGRAGCPSKCRHANAMLR